MNKGPYKKTKFYMELEDSFTCPCLSGLNYLSCHKFKINKKSNKEFNENTYIKEMFEINLSLKEVATCMFSNCVEKPINSHTIQKSKYINFIAENGMIYSTVDKLNNKHQKNDAGFELPFSKIGKKYATSFRGFCQNHDNDLFSKIEKEKIIPDSNQVVLLCYKAICRASYEMEKITKSLSAIFKKYPFLVKNPLFIHQWTEMYSEYYQKKSFKEEIEKSIIEPSTLKSIFYESFIFESQNNLTVMSCLWKLKDLENNNLCSQYAYFDSKGEGMFFLFILPTLKETNVIFACLNNRIKTIEFIKQISNCSEQVIKSIINNMILNNSDVGVALRPEWFEKNKQYFLTDDFSVTIGLMSKDRTIQKEKWKKNILNTTDFIWK